MRLVKKLFRVRPWVFSVAGHLVLFGILVVPLIRHPAPVNLPPKIFSSQLNIQNAPTQQMLETSRPDFSTPLNPDRSAEPELSKPEEALTQSDKVYEFTVDPSLKKMIDIPDTLVVRTFANMPPKNVHQSIKRPTARPKPANAAANAFVPAQPNKDPNQNPLPEYPTKARDEGQEGLVILSVEVLADGTVGQVELTQSSGWALLDESAQKTVRHWKFVPAQVNGKPTTSTIKIPIRFKLE